MAQSQISRSKEFKYIQIIDSTRKDIKLLKSIENDLISQNSHLSLLAKERKHKLQRNRKISLVSICIAVLCIIIP